MRKNKVKQKVYIIIILASISLIGIVSMQVYWINKAQKLKHEQFDNKVKLALKMVINELIEYNRIDNYKSNINQSFYEINPNNIKQFIKPELLDSLLRTELEYYNIKENYDYGIFNPSQNKILLGKYHHNKNNLFTSQYISKLSCSLYKECYYISIYFPDTFWIILKDSLTWVIYSIIFILISIGSFTFTIISLIKQKKISEMKNDFINNMTHEFKTPLSTISLTSEMLMNPGTFIDSNKVTRYAKIIHEENNRLKIQVDKILQTAQFEKGSDNLNRIEFDFNEFVRNYTKTYLEHHYEREITINLTLQADKSIISADIVHIENIMNNLVDNAIKYCNTSPEINIKTYNDNNKLIIEVSDNGIGIKSEFLPFIFQQFYRVPTGNLHNVKGFGIGLYYVKKIIQLHGADIQVKSIENKGTTFTIIFP